MASTKVVNQVHCRSCGNILDEECGQWEGYTTCCNKPTAQPGCGTSCSHLELDGDRDDWRRRTMYGPKGSDY